MSDSDSFTASSSEDECNDYSPEYLFESLTLQDKIHNCRSCFQPHSSVQVNEAIRCREELLFLRAERLQLIQALQRLQKERRELERERNQLLKEMNQLRKQLKILEEDEQRKTQKVILVKGNATLRKEEFLVKENELFREDIEELVMTFIYLWIIAIMSKNFKS